MEQTIPLQNRILAFGLGLALALCAALTLPALSRAEVVPSTGEVQFGSVAIGDGQVGSNVFLTNQGANPIVIEDVTITGANAADFVILGQNCTGTLPASGTCEVSTLFTPQATGPRAAALDFDAEGGVASSVELAGTGFLKQLTLPATFDFGAGVVGTGTEEVLLPVENKSEAPVSITKFEINGPNAADFQIKGDTCNGMVLQGTSCGVRIVWSPSQLGQEEATIKVVSDGFPAEPTAALEGEGVTAELVFEPPSFDFGIAEVHGESTQATLQLRNAGLAPTQINSINIGGPGSNEFSTNGGTCFGTLLSGQSCELNVAFHPNNEGVFSARVTVGVAGGASFEIELTGTGVRPLVTSSPDPADFGAVGVGAPEAVQTLTLTNSGLLPVGFFIAIISGGDTESFHLIEEDCTGRMILPTETCTAKIRFTPTAAGLRKATASFFGNGEGALQVPLSGTGVAADAALSPASRDFGTQAAGTSGAVQSLSLVNDGAAPLEVGSVGLFGPDAGEFRLAGDACEETVLAPGASCALGIRFAPTSAGTKSATLRVRTGAGVRTAALVGQATAADGSSGSSSSGTATASAPATAASHPGSVGVQFPSSLRLPYNAGSAIKLATTRCSSATQCSVKVNASVVGNVSREGSSRQRTVAIPKLQLKVRPGDLGDIKVKLSNAAIELAEQSKAKIVIRLRWSTGEAHDELSKSLRLQS